MRFAVWKEPALDFFARGLKTLSEKFDLELIREDRRKCRDLLVLGEVDVALVPTLSAFTENEFFELLPAVAISTWDFPFLKLHLKESLGSPIKSVAIDPFFAQEAIVARILLKEHYDATPSFHPHADLSPDILLRTDDDAALIMSSSYGEEVSASDGFDIGRDWFELTHYPMVWGLFATRKGEAASLAVQRLRDIAHFVEVFKGRWLEEEEIPDALKAFYSEGIRYRLDDMAIASLTAFQDFLYYDNVVEEIDPLVFYEVMQTMDDDEEEQPLL